MAALFVVGTGKLGAQGPANLRVLAIPPDRPMFCRHLDQGPGDSLPPGFVAREFRFTDDGGGNPIVWIRHITVVFDSAGETAFLSDETSLGLKGSESVLSRSIHGTPTIGTRTDVTVDSVLLDAAKAKGDLSAMRAAIRPPVSRALTPDESKKVAQLGKWLWARKCP